MTETSRNEYVEFIKHQIDKVDRNELGFGLFYNNFIFRFKDYQFLMESAKLMDTPYSSIYPPGEADTNAVSDKFLSQTPSEFYRTIDEIVEELGYSEDIAEIVKDRRKPENAKRFKEIAPSIFLRLIEAGYNNTELTT